MLALIRSLVADGKARVSEHGFVKLRENGINLSDLVRAVGNAEVVEDYPDYHKGRAFWCCIEKQTVDRFMLFGERRDRSRTKRP